MKWCTARRRIHTCNWRVTRRAQYNIWQHKHKFVFLRWETFYFVTSSENNFRITTLTLSLTTFHLTADTESGQRVFLRHSLLKLPLTSVSTALTHVFQNHRLASEKHLEWQFLVSVQQNVSLSVHLMTHSEHPWDPLLGRDPPVEKHCICSKKSMQVNTAAYHHECTVILVYDWRKLLNIIMCVHLVGGVISQLDK